MSDPTQAPPKERFEQAAQSKQGGDDHENDLWSGSYSHLAMIGTWAVGVLVSVGVLIAGLFTGLDFLLALGIVALLWLALGGWYAYRRYSVHYRLTNQRLIHAAGLLWRTNDRVELIDVDDVTYRQGPVERLFGVGTIIVTSSDRSTPELTMPGIENARDVADQIDDARRAERRSRGLHIEAV